MASHDSNEHLNNLRETIGKLDLALGCINEAVVCVDSDFNIQWCNDKFINLTGKLRIQVLSKNIDTFFNLYTNYNTKVTISERCKTITETKEEEIYSLTEDNSSFINIFASFAYASEKDNYYIIVLRDVTDEQKYIEEITSHRQELSELSEYLESIISNISNMLIVVSRDLNIIKVNNMVSKTLGYEYKNLIGNSIYNLLSSSEDKDKQNIRDSYNNDEIIDRLMSFKTIKNHELSFRTSDNRDIPVLFSSSPVFKGNQELVCIAQDITELKSAQKKAQYLATHDSLTSLLNRAVFDESIKKEIARSKRHGLTMALLFIDVDNFKHINDSLGHDVGDEVLKYIATILNNNVRVEDTLARFSKSDSFLGRIGGDEFVVILPELQDSLDAGRFAKRILDFFSNPFHIRNKDLYIGLSIGIAVYPHDGTDSDIIIKHADLAMYQAKESGRNNYNYYKEEYSAKYKIELNIENDIQTALSNKQFYLEYQPQCYTKSGQIRGFEALIRWKHPKYGVIQPDKFIPIAERTRLIRDIGSWVIEQACIDYSRWKKLGVLNNNEIMSINISPYQLVDNEFIDGVKYIINKYKVDISILEFEITETAIMTTLLGSETVLNDVKNLGIKIAIDDFGTGYSSLSKIKQLPISTLKLDKEFIKLIDKNDYNSKITESIITLAKKLNLSTIGEGVETENQLKYLKEFGCDHIQGYYYYKPMQEKELQKILKKYADR